MQPDEKTIYYTPTRADLLAFHTRALLRNRLLLGSACCAFLLVVITDTIHPSDPTIPFAVNLIAAILAGFFIVLVGGIVGFLFLIITVWTGKFKNVLTEQIAIITSDGLVGKSAAGESLLKWSGIHKVDSTKKLLIIYTNETTARIIPKRFFSTPHSASAYEQDIRSRMQPN